MQTAKRRQFVFVLLLSMVVLALAAPSNRTLILSGHSGEIPVIDLKGRSYIEIEAFTRLAGGSLRFKGSQIELTLPSSADAQATASPVPAHDGTTGFSKDFVKAGIEEMSVIREWRSALKNAVQQGYPITQEWADHYRALAQKSLGLVSVAASTESDQNALRLLTNEFNNMNTLSEQYLKTSKSQTYVSPDALNNDPLDQKILNCAHSLVTMVTNNQFVDNGSCQ